VQVLNARVSRIEDRAVIVTDKAGNEKEILFGACVWATGIAKNPLVKQIQSKLESQTHFRALLTDDYLRVLGSNHSIWAIGDAATVAAAKALEFADELFEEADTVKDGWLSLAELQVSLSASHIALKMTVLSLVSVGRRVRSFFLRKMPYPGNTMKRASRRRSLMSSHVWSMHSSVCLV
jgi:NADH dehydrogenase FAD-containing subunit